MKNHTKRRGHTVINVKLKFRLMVTTKDNNIKRLKLNYKINENKMSILRNLLENIIDLDEETRNRRILEAINRDNMQIIDEVQVPPFQCDALECSNGQLIDNLKGIDQALRCELQQCREHGRRRQLISDIHEIKKTIEFYNLDCELYHLMISPDESTIAIEIEMYEELKHLASYITTPQRRNGIEQRLDVYRSYFEIEVVQEQSGNSDEEDVESEEEYINTYVPFSKINVVKQKFEKNTERVMYNELPKRPPIGEEIRKMWKRRSYHTRRYTYDPVEAFERSIQDHPWKLISIYRYYNLLRSRFDQRGNFVHAMYVLKKILRNHQFGKRMRLRRKMQFNFLCKRAGIEPLFEFEKCEVTHLFTDDVVEEVNEQMWKAGTSVEKSIETFEKASVVLDQISEKLDSLDVNNLNATVETLKQEIIKAGDSVREGMKDITAVLHDKTNTLTSGAMRVMEVGTIGMMTIVQWVIELVTVISIYQFVPRYVFYGVLVSRLIVWFTPLITDMEKFMARIKDYISAFVDKTTGVVYPKFNNLFSKATKGQPIECSEAEPVQEQSAEGMMIFGNQALGAIITAAMASLIGNSMRGDTIDRALKSCDGLFKVTRALDNIPKLCGFIGMVIEKVTLFLLGEKHPLAMYSQNLKADKDDVCNWATRVAEIAQDDIRQTINYTVSLQEEIAMLKDKANTYIKKYCGDNRHPQLSNLIKFSFKTCSELYDVMIKSKGQGGMRFDPYCIYMAGPSGVGKSTWTQELAHAIAQIEGVPIEGRIWVRSVADDYFSGLRKPFAVMYDDAFQVNGEDMRKEIREIFAIKSNPAYQPNMADLPDKGRYFDAKVLLITSNQAYPSPNEVMDEAALQRRRQRLVFCKSNGGKLDIINKTHMDFHILDPKNSNDVPSHSNKVTWAALMQDILNDWKQYKATQEIILGYYNSMDEKYAPIVKEQGRKTMRPDELEEIANISYIRRVQQIKGNDVYLDTERHKSPEASMKFNRFKQIYFTSEMRLRVLAEQGCITRIRVLPDSALGNHENVTPLFRQMNLKWKLNLPDDERPFVTKPLTVEEICSREAEIGFEALSKELDNIEAINRRPFAFDMDDLRPYLSKCFFLEMKEYDVQINCDIPRHMIEMLVFWYRKYDTPQKRVEFLEPEEVKEQGKWFISKDYRDLLKKYTKGELSFLIDEYDPAVSTFRLDHLPDGLWEIAKDVNENLTPEEVKDLVENLKKGSVTYSRTRMAYCRVIDAFLATQKGLRTMWREFQEMHPIVKMMAYFSLGFAIGGISHIMTGKTPTDWVVHGINKLDTKFFPKKEEAAYATHRLPRHKVHSAVKVRGEDALRLAQDVLDERDVKDLEKIVDVLDVKKKPIDFALLNSFSKALPTEIRQEFMGRIDEMYEVNEQGTNDPNAMAVRDNMILRSIYQARIMRPDGSTWYTNCLAIGGRWILAPAHLFRRFEMFPGSHLNLRNYDTSYNIEWDQRKLRLSKDEDFGIYECSPRFPLHKDLRKHFVNNKDLLHYTRGTGQLLTLHHDDLYPLPNQCNIIANDKTVRYGIFDYHAKADNLTYQERYAWRHDVQTKDGDCGSPLLAFNKHLAGKLIGIHVAGRENDNTGWAVVLTEEKIRRILPEDLFKVRDIAEYVDEQGAPRFTLPKGYEYIGTCAPELANVMQTKTDIRPSVLHDEIFPHITEPSVLKANDVRNISGTKPMQLGLAKYTKETLPLPGRTLDIVQQELDGIYEGIKPLRNLGYIDMDLLVNGIPVENYERMNPNSSVGWPYVKYKPRGAASGKRWIYKELDDGRNEIVNERILDDFERKLRLLIDGELEPCVKIHCLKDERRGIMKIRAGKTRIFTMSNVVETLLIRLFWIDAVAAIYKSRNHTFSAVGIDPLSPEWTEMFDWLTEYGFDVFDFDWQNFDGSLDPDAMWRDTENINHWYDSHGNGIVFDFYGKRFEISAEQCNRARLLLTEDMIHSYQIVNNVVHRKHQGNPSGVAITVVKNGGVNQYYIRTAYYLLQSENEKNNYPFDTMVRSKVYGDDGVIVPKATIRHWFNYRSFSEKLKRFNLVCTPANKTGEAYETIPIYDASFLKRGFVPDEEEPWKIKAPIELGTAFEMINWVRECDDEVLACLDNVDACLREIIHHDINVAGSLRKLINDTLVRKHLPCSVFSPAGAKEHWRRAFF